MTALAPRVNFAQSHMKQTADAALQPLYDEARAAWPGVELSFAEFAAAVTAAAASVDAPATAHSHARDLYLARACANGDVLALRELDQRYLAVTYDAIARIDRSVDFIAEVQQRLRERLLVGPSAKIKAYRGSGPLGGWVRTAAVRCALNLRRDDPQHNQTVSKELSALLDPELAAVKQRCTSELSGALARAVAALASEERMLLRCYYVDKLTLAKIAAREKLGVATIFRRLEAASRAVQHAVRSELQGKLRLSTESLDSLIREARHDIDLNLSQLLASVTEES
jgi:RNA polymerase sigma-70 factor (ECF subfamily)